MSLFYRSVLKNFQVSNSNSRFSYLNIKFRKFNYKKIAMKLIVKILPIHECFLSYIDTRLVRFLMLGNNVLDRFWMGTPLCHTIYIQIKLVFKHIPSRHHQRKTLWICYLQQPVSRTRCYIKGKPKNKEKPKF